MILTYISFPSKIGTLFLAEKEGKLIYSSLGNSGFEEMKKELQKKYPRCELKKVGENSKSIGVLYKAREEILEYLDGKRTEFDIPCETTGTDFQKTVWKNLSKIPFGKTVSYGELAAKSGKPKAARAVGSACGKNSIPLIIPCHRVLAANKKLGGFGGGPELKSLLLKLEGIQL